MTQQPMADAPRDGTWIRLYGAFAPPDGIEVQWATHPDIRFPGVTVNGEAGFWRTRDGDMAVFEAPSWSPITPVPTGR